MPSEQAQETGKEMSLDTVAPSSLPPGLHVSHSRKEASRMVGIWVLTTSVGMHQQSQNNVGWDSFRVNRLTSEQSSAPKHKSLMIRAKTLQIVDMGRIS